MTAGSHELVISPPERWESWLNKFDNLQNFMFAKQFHASAEIVEAEKSAGLHDLVDPLLSLKRNEFRK